MGFSLAIQNADSRRQTNRTKYDYHGRNFFCHPFLNGMHVHGSRVHADFSLQASKGSYILIVMRLMYIHGSGGPI